jgi:predicted GIY-YIG superfamily endonuclease
MRENLCFACIMASRSHTLYIGVTSNLHKRVFQHKWREHALCSSFAFSRGDAFIIPTAGLSAKATSFAGGKR